MFDVRQHFKIFYYQPPPLHIIRRAGYKPKSTNVSSYSAQHIHVNVTFCGSKMVNIFFSQENVCDDPNPNNAWTLPEDVPIAVSTCLIWDILRAGLMNQLRQSVRGSLKVQAPSFCPSCKWSTRNKFSAVGLLSTFYAHILHNPVHYFADLLTSDWQSHWVQLSVEFAFTICLANKIK